jgi:hypothetical protein
MPDGRDSSLPLPTMAVHPQHILPLPPASGALSDQVKSFNRSELAQNQKVKGFCVSAKRGGPPIGNPQSKNKNGALTDRTGPANAPSRHSFQEDRRSLPPVRNAEPQPT